MIRRWAPALAGRTLLMAALWWAATEGRAINWPLAAAGVVLAVAASIRLRPPVGWEPGGFVRFVGFFLLHSLLGGIDVALRAVRPGPPLRPGFITLGLRLADPQSRLVVTRTISLLPGTLGVDLEDDRLTIHVLDVEMANERLLRRCEDRVAALHATTLTDADGQAPGGSAPLP